MKRTIEIIVSPKGDISIDAVGFKGPACENATRALEEALGVVQRRNKKPEYLTKATSVAQQKVGT
jgi:hypothetical protein